VRDARNWLDNRIAPPKTTGVIQLPPGTPIGCCGGPWRKALFPQPLIVSAV